MPDNQIWRDSSHRLTYSLFRVKAADYPAICQAVADAFHLVPDGSPIMGPDQMFWDFRRADLVVGFDWDNWMGFMVVAKTGAAEPLVQEIAAWLGSIGWVAGAAGKPR